MANKSKKTKRPYADPEVHLFAERVRRMTDLRIYEEYHKAPGLDVVEGVAREMFSDIVSVLAPHFEDDLLREISDILSNWYGCEKVGKIEDTHKAETDKAVADAPQEVIPGELYRHIGGNYYRVLYTAIDSATKRPMVVYQSAEVTDRTCAFCRFKKDFLAEVDHTRYPNAVQQYVYQHVRKKES